MKKYLISETKLENLITNYIEGLFPIENINWTHPEEYDSDEMETFEDPSRIEYYFGDYGDDETCFRWYSCDYFGSAAQSICPLVMVETYYQKQLNSLFNDRWHEPFRKWFIENFNQPVKSIE